MDKSIEYIYDLIKTYYITSNNSITDDFINNLLFNYDENKVIYCFQTLNNIDIDFEINNNLHETTEEQLSIIKARKDDKFRKIIHKRFNNNCIICEPNTCFPTCYQVAHIWDFSKCDASSKYNPDNGLLMCANWHLLFDANLMRLEPIVNSIGMVQIILDAELKHNIMYKYHNKIITILPENIPFLEKRNNGFL